MSACPAIISWAMSQLFLQGNAQRPAPPRHARARSRSLDVLGNALGGEGRGRGRWGPGTHVILTHVVPGGRDTLRGPGARRWKWGSERERKNHNTGREFQGIQLLLLYNSALVQGGGWKGHGTAAKGSSRGGNNFEFRCTNFKN